MNRSPNKSRSQTSNDKKTSKRGNGRTAFDALKTAASRIVKGVKEAADAPEPATKLLTKQHDEVRALFKRLERSRARKQQLEIFEEIAQNLVAHDAIEREIFYPACEQAMGMTDTLGEALVEHGVVEFSLFQSDEARKEDDFEFKCTVLKEVLEHHIKEEEDEFFPRVERALGKEKLLELGARMKERFEEALASDFRQPLHKNLNGVLAGALKPNARSASKSPRGRRSSAPPPKSSRQPKSSRRKRAA